MKTQTLVINGQEIQLTKNELVGVQVALDKAQKDGTIGYELKVELMQALTREK